MQMGNKNSFCASPLPEKTMFQTSSARHLTRGEAQLRATKEVLYFRQAFSTEAN